MNLDLKSVAATIIFLEIVIGILTVVAGKSYPGKSSGLKPWGYLTIWQGMTWILFNLGEYLPAKLHRSLAPLLIVMTFWGYSALLRRFLSKKPHHAFFIGLVSGLFATQIIFSYLIPNEPYRVICVAIAVLIFSAELVNILLINNPESRLASHRLLAATSVFLALFYLLRLAYFSLQSFGYARWPFTVENLMPITMLWSGGCSVVSTYAYMLMCNDRYLELKHRAEIDRERSENEFQIVRDNVPVMIWMLDERGNISWLNKAWLHFTGQTLEDARESDWLEYVHPDDQRRMQTVLENALQSSQPYSLEYRLRRKDGIFRWVLETGFPMHADEGRISGFAGSTIDITEHKHQQQQIEALSAEVMRISETERTEIAGELHDSLGQSLALASLRVQASLAKIPEITAEDKKNILEPINSALRNARDISHRLVPAHLESVGLKMAIDDMLATVAQSGRFIIHAETEALESIFTHGWNIDLYRIVQESITNIIKHADADEIRILTERTSLGLSVTITDNGTRNTIERKAKDGIGLLLMQQRAKSFGGTVEFTHADTGFAVRIEIPGQFDATVI